MRAYLNGGRRLLAPPTPWKHGTTSVTAANYWCVSTAGLCSAGSGCWFNSSSVGLRAQPCCVGLSSASVSESNDGSVYCDSCTFSSSLRQSEAAQEAWIMKRFPSAWPEGSRRSLHPCLPPTAKVNVASIFNRSVTRGGNVRFKRHCGIKVKPLV